MGNLQSKSCVHHKANKDSLRDYSVNTRFPSSISKPTSNLLLAFADGNYYPCIILNRSSTFTDGYLVFFLHSQTETEIPACNVIGNFKALMDCSVSFISDGRHCTGKVYDIGRNEKNEATNFFLGCGEHCAWVSLPFIFLTPEQANQISC